MSIIKMWVTMIKIVVLISLTTISLNAESFTKNNILGKWEVSAVKYNNYVSFAKYIAKTRGEKIHLIFNPHMKMKIKETKETFEYEILNGKLKIYEIKHTARGNKIDKQTTPWKYDMYYLEKPFEGCHVMKTETKKLLGLKKKDGVKICKIEDYPTATFNVDIKDYNF